MIGVLGASGTIGSLLVSKLSGQGHATRALVHHFKGATQLALPHVEVQIGDYSNDVDLHKFLAGLDQLFLLTAPSEEQLEVENHIIDLAKDASVKGITKLSAWTAAEDSPLLLSRQHHAIEVYLAASGIPYTILEPHTFMQTTSMTFSDEIGRNRTMTSSVTSEAGIFMVDVRDVAEVAAAVLTHAQHRGETLVIHGPEALSYVDCASLISRHLDREIRYHLVSHSEAKERFLKAGMGEFLADTLTTLSQMYNSGRYEPASNTVIEDWAGHRPRTYQDFLEECPDAFQ
ncbi:hypothetical protein BDV38DRAFT_484 [Aspergillus pseudotamarii]|uniref:NmrA-like domain-containing protein n=1 Tax=Aspergillus pseudotamarii TaxID=132259 RepID=A0A5N6TBA1_ASPPS|nr:uncharacterized protein BDV38DRAFT_484 [Aspergillus pseudotamarii]KAE8143550.1 hypothetical protein BDV38DRAFT_484 [Aspergillus pseudotamarii]